MLARIISRASNVQSAVLAYDLPDGRQVVYEPNKPWNYIFACPNKDWWEEHFVQPAQSIAMRLAPGDTFLNGSDSLVASSPVHHFATQASETVALYSAQASTPSQQRPPPATKPPKGGKGAKGKQTADKFGGIKNHAANRCTWFNSGSCSKPAFGCVCPSDPTKLHTCSKCGQDSHAAKDCRSGQKTNQQRQQQWSGQHKAKKTRGAARNGSNGTG